MKKALFLLPMLALMAYPSYALTTINAQSGTACNDYGFCSTTIDLKSFMTTSQITTVKSFDIASLLPKMKQIESISYKFNGTKLIISGHVNETVYWLMDLKNGFIIDPTWSLNFGSRMNITNSSQVNVSGSYQRPYNLSYNSLMQTDFDDIRFVTLDGTELNYWREDYVASSWARFWINVTYTANQPFVIYAYFNNATVSTTSNGFNTFLFFDDFEDNSLNTTKWINVVRNTTEANGILYVDGRYPSKGLATVDANYTNPETVWVEANTSCLPVEWPDGCFLRTDYADATHYTQVGYRRNSGGIGRYYSYDFNGVGVEVSQAWTDNTPYKLYGWSNATNNMVDWSGISNGMRNGSAVTNGKVNPASWQATFRFYWILIANWTDGLPSLSNTTYENRTFSTSINLFLNGNESNVTINTATNLNATAVINVTGLNVSLYVDDVLVNNTETSTSYISTLAVGLHNITGYFAGNSTHDTSSATWWANVFEPIKPIVDNTVICFATQPVCINLKDSTLIYRKEGYYG